ncbi:hypothetical protein [Pseudomonas putida]|uniref:hypothetical protein n=1 Tax=Pseudomonas putida TaxID=303 RepID=UPI0012ACDF29|nr:hypothetical protein [Pseudomonas putida]
MFEITMLPAREGDALWIRWGDADNPRQMLVDSGIKASGRKLKSLITAMPEERRHFDLIVITHIDCDHIWGAISCFVESPKIPNLSISDFWFNGHKHLVESQHTLESLGPIQGDELSNWLEYSGHWNLAFDKKAVSTSSDGQPIKIVLPGNMVVTVIGPTPKRLYELAPSWPEAMSEALNEAPPPVVGLEELGARSSIDISSLEDLDEVANAQFVADTSTTNASSITLVLEYEGKRVLLAGDALASDLIGAFEKFTDRLPISFDAVKVPHHGSEKNVSKELMASISCDKWLISTDGNKHHHPDIAAVARIITCANEPSIYFNVPSIHNDLWGRKRWQAEFKYQAFYGDQTKGLTVEVG